MEKMNRLFLWGLLIALIVGFAACSDDDKDSNNGEPTIQREWRYEQSDGEYVQEFRFNADGTFTEVEQEYYRSAGEWRTRNNKGTYIFEQMRLTLNYTYYYDEESTYTEEYVITELTPKIMTLENRYGHETTYERI